MRNLDWVIANVRDQYSHTNSHGDLYRYLSQWVPIELHLNVGYSSRGEPHLHPASPLRLIERLADRLLDLHARGRYATDRHLLDVGSGRGGAAIHAHRRYGLGVVGVDITAHNVACADRNARHEGVRSHVRFCLGDALDLPLPDACFSLAWSIESPAHYSDKTRFLREVARVLKPGGALAFADLLVVPAVATATVGHRRVYEEFLQVWDVPYLETYEGYRRSIDEAGFELQEAEIATRHNLELLRRYCETFLWWFRWQPLYRAYRPYVRWRTGADLDHVYAHVLASHRALWLRMIDYGLFWARRR